MVNWPKFVGLNEKSFLPFPTTEGQSKIGSDFGSDFLRNLGRWNLILPSMGDGNLYANLHFLGCFLLINSTVAFMHINCNSEFEIVKVMID